MKMKFKNFMFFLFFGTTLITSSIFTSGNIHIEKQQENIKVENKQAKNNYGNSNVYNLAPGEIFDPYSGTFNDYWVNMERFWNDNFNTTQYAAAWLMAVKNVTTTIEGYYQISFDYSFYNNLYYNEYWLATLNVYNTNYTYNNFFKLNNIYTNGTSTRNVKNAIIQVPKSAVFNGQKLVFDMKFERVKGNMDSMQVFGDVEPVFDVNNYPYLNEFDVKSFSFVNDSTTDEGFEFLIDAREVATNTSIKNPRGLILYSNGFPLNTQFEGYQGTTLLKYKVSGLSPNSIYTDFSIAINGYEGILSVGNFNINTKPENGINSNAGVIAGSTIGGLVLLLLIILLIVYLIKRSNKVEEHNVYNEYITYEDENGEQVQTTKEEYDQQYEDYQTPKEPESEYLNGNYNFVQNQNSHEEDPGFY